MNDLKAVSCCFTGHRNIPASSEQAVMARTEEIVRVLITEGVAHFNVGGAVGYDTLVAQLLFHLRDPEFPQVKVILVYPYDGYTSGWNEEQKATYARILPIVR